MAGNELPDFIPVSMLTQYAYCPRLFFLEWVDQEWADSADTEEGQFHHRRVDRRGGAVPGPQAEGASQEEPIHARSVLLSSERLGLICRLDLLEGNGESVSPVEYKRGTTPEVEMGAWEPDRVQVCAQALILRDNGYRCDVGFLYYVASHQQVRVALDSGLIERTEALVGQLRACAVRGEIPLPLVGSPKCPRCSLVGICLPDETRVLGGQENGDSEPRRLVPARDDALPVYVQTQGLQVGKSGDRLVVKDRGEVVSDVRLIDVSQLCVLGNVQVTTQLLHELCDREVPVSYFTTGGWLYGIVRGLGHRNVELRRRQFRLAEDPAFAGALAGRIVEAKIRNCRTLLRRNGVGVPDEALQNLSDLAHKARQGLPPESLLGVEGTAARIYFGNFAAMFKPNTGAEVSFDFRGRNRRPPRDPVNALLSFAYSLLCKEFVVTLSAVGFDPYMGFYHTPRYGRPALALDLMEEFRPLVADSVVISVLNNGEVTQRDFIARAGAVALTETGRKKFIVAFERRMDSLITHPIFGYSISYRRVLEVQARLLGRYLSGEINEYPQFLTR